MEYPDTDVTSFVLERAEELGDTPALIDGPTGRTITYAELDNATKALAAGLAARGFEPGDSLCVYLPNLPEYAIAFHGVARAGGRASTANPLYTSRELQHQLEDSGSKFLLTIPQFLDVAREAAEAAGVEEIFVVGHAEDGATALSDLMGDPGDAPEVDVSGDDLAVLPYSSGTTGLPKGVMLTHKNLVANLVQIQQAFAIKESDVLVGVLPFFHIYGQTVIMNQGLRAGATIVSMPRFDLEQFLDLIQEHGVSQVYVVPPIALALAKHPAVDERDLSSIKTVMSGAAPLGAELADKVAERLDCNVIQGYGMTETSPVTHIVRPDGENRAGSIGKELEDTECRIVDVESGEDAPDGERGELWIRGPQVMAGYLNNDEATAETIDSDGWLHTGDIAVRDEDGFYFIVDRLKELIKYKGFQVPPAELEAILINHPGVADVAVIGIQDEDAGEIPKAYVVAAGDAELDHEELMGYVAKQVSPQKKVRLVEEIDEIPKSASGKILRRELRDRDPDAAEA
ncbi:MAG: 4-coumarate--CoA ligase family protein [Actinomycetota bacterium]|nr:4-coumarate--CoA ligase family protein [Actinomycetota bacterium]